MNEPQYIYARLKFLGDQVEHLTDLLEKQQELIGGLVGAIEKMQTPEYARKQAQVAEGAKVADKLAFIQGMLRKGGR